MVYEISDGKLKAAVDSLGAELTSLRKISPGGGIRDSAGACAYGCASGPAEAFADGMNKGAAEFADHVVSVLKNELRNRADEAKTAPEKRGGAPRLEIS